MTPNMSDSTQQQKASICDVVWVMYPPMSCFDCRVALLQEPAGGFSVYAVNLPGVCSEGETEEEAITNIIEALSGVLSEYVAAGEIPWSEEHLEEGCFERRVIVNLNETPVAA
jgi:predicted RNase H-like HicB family nuclease